MLEDVLETKDAELPKVVVFTDLSTATYDQFRELKHRYAKDGRVIVWYEDDGVTMSVNVTSDDRTTWLFDVNPNEMMRQGPVLVFEDGLSSSSSLPISYLVPPTAVFSGDGFSVAVMDNNLNRMTVWSRDGSMIKVKLDNAFYAVPSNYLYTNHGKFISTGGRNIEKLYLYDTNHKDVYRVEKNGEVSLLMERAITFDIYEDTAIYSNWSDGLCLMNLKDGKNTVRKIEEKNVEYFITSPELDYIYYRKAGATDPALYCGAPAGYDTGEEKELHDRTGYRGIP